MDGYYESKKATSGRKLQTFLSSVYIDLLLLGFFIFLSHLFYYLMASSLHCKCL